MIVVSDTTPLISLMKIGRLDLIERLFGEVQIPETVYIELISNPRFAEEAQQIIRNPFIRRVVIEDGKAVDLLSRATGLDRGESEAIILSDTCKADLLLMDENKGRQVAKLMGLHLMGTVGMLRAAWLTEEELITPDAQPENFCIGIIDGKIACAFILQWADSEYWPNAPKYEAAYFHKFCVRRKFAGMGMTKLVTEAIRAECRKRSIRYIRLDTGLDERVVRNIYLNAGCRPWPRSWESAHRQ